MILHMRHTLWTGISETNVNFITSATRIHAFNNNNTFILKHHLSRLNSYLNMAIVLSVNVAYNNSFRILHHLPSRCSASFMFVSNHIKSFNELIRSSIFSLLRRLQDSENPLVVNYFYTDIHFRSPMFKYWTTQLYV